MLSYPGLIAGAMIFATIVVQLRDENYFSLIFIGLFSVPILGSLIYLSYKDLDLLGYLLILIPIILVWVGYRMGIKMPEPAKDPVIESAPAEQKKDDNCNVCTRVPCVCPVQIT